MSTAAVALSSSAGGLTPAQLVARRAGIGASEVAAVLGLDPYRTAYDVWVAKVAPHLREDTTGIAARRGHALEPLVAELYAERIPGVTLTMGGTIAHPDFPMVLATPDRYAEFLGDEYLVEIKTKTWRTAQGFGSEGSDEIPDTVQLQAQQQMLVTGRRRCDVVVLVDDELKVFTVMANEEIHSHILATVPAWWERHVVQGEQPEVDGSDAAIAYLRATLKQGTKDLVEGGETEAELMLALADANARLKAAEADKALVTQQLCELTGEAGGILTGTGKFTWLEQKSPEKTKWPDLVKEAGISADLIAKHTSRAAPIRVARFTPAK